MQPLDETPVCNERQNCDDDGQLTLLRDQQDASHCSH